MPEDQTGRHPPPSSSVGLVDKRLGRNGKGHWLCPFGVARLGTPGGPTLSFWSVTRDP